MSEESPTEELPTSDADSAESETPAPDTLNLEDFDNVLYRSRESSIEVSEKD